MEISENHAQFIRDDHQTPAIKCHKKRDRSVFRYLYVTAAHMSDLLAQPPAAPEL